MKFLENGPDIPEELIEECVHGNIVFFCGAGISCDAGIPGFRELTAQLIEALAPEPESDIYKWFKPDCKYLTTPYPDIYQALQDEFEAAWVENLISQFIDPRPKTRKASNNHKLLIELSQNLNGQSQIVTTNIDTLFTEELAHNNDATIYEPPHLPDGEFAGIVYLHGQHKKPDTGLERKNYIFSSSDFGRAYLTESWAKNFIMRLLLSGKSIIFVGYSADDPPVKFLLQALHASKETFQLYAFADYNGQSSPEAIRQSWQNKGVHVIPYESLDDRKDHSHLWNSLNEWNQQKNSPERWTAKQQEYASKNPRELQPHEREQVLNWLKTSDGRNFFNNKKTLPPAEWICVFDDRIRRKSPVNLRTGPFDPKEEYGLPNDKYKDEKNTEGIISEEFKTNMEQGVHFPALKKLSTGPYIQNWFILHMNCPGMYWWASGLPILPSWLKEHIEWTLTQPASKLLPRAKQLWELLLKAFKDDRRQTTQNSIERTYNDACYALKSSGHTAQNLLKLKDSLIPQITIKRPEPYYLRSFFPPEDMWTELPYTRNIADLDVVFSVHRNFLDKLSIKSRYPSQLAEIFHLFRDALDSARLLLEQTESDTIGWEIEDLPHEPNDAYDTNVSPIWCKTGELFDRLVELDKNLAKAEVFTWPNNDRFFFDKLKLYAWTNTALFTADKAADGILTLSSETLWTRQHQQQLIRCLKTHWSDINPEKQGLLENKICHGWKDNQELDKEECAFVDELITRLQAEQITLSAQTIGFRNSIQKNAQDYLNSSAKAFDVAMTELGIRDKNADYPLLLNTQKQKTPLPGDILHKEQFRKDFEEVIRKNPIQALAILKANGEPDKNIIYWQSLALCCSENLTTDDRRLIAESFSQLPANCLVNLANTLPRWFSVHLPMHASENINEALEWWDKYFNHLKLLPDEFHAKTRAHGHNEHSKSSYLHLSSSPIFMMIETLLRVDISEALKRCERALALPIPIQKQTICVLSHYLEKIYNQNPEWVRQHLLPHFSNENMESAWSGFFYLKNDRDCHKDLYSSLEEGIIQAAEHSQKWQWGNLKATEMLTKLFVEKGLFNDNLTIAQKRQFIRNIGDDGRCKFISILIDSYKYDDLPWDSIRSLLEKSWPRNAAIKTTSLTQQFVSLALSAIKNSHSAEEIINQILPFAGKSKNLRISQLRKVKPEQAMPILKLLNHIITDNPNEQPFALLHIVDQTIAMKGTKEWKRLSRIASAQYS